jgi:hypothetical protein
MDNTGNDANSPILLRQYVIWDDRCGCIGGELPRRSNWRAVYLADGELRSGDSKSGEVQVILEIVTKKMCYTNAFLKIFDNYSLLYSLLSFTIHVSFKSRQWRIQGAIAHPTSGGMGQFFSSIHFMQCGVIAIVSTLLLCATWIKQRMDS